MYIGKIDFGGRKEIYIFFFLFLMKTERKCVFLIINETKCQTIKLE